MQDLRTTSAAENYHGILNSRIPSNGNFFRFVNCLQKEEFQKRNEFKAVLDGNINVFKAKDKKLRKRHKIIKKATRQLKNGKISFKQFLNKMTYKENNILIDSLDHDIDNENSTDFESDDDEGMDSPNELSQSNTPFEDNSSKCCVCLTEKVTVLMLPCKHLCSCSPCYEKLASQYKKSRTHILCPYCRANVANTVDNIFVG